MIEGIDNLLRAAKDSGRFVWRLKQGRKKKPLTEMPDDCHDEQSAFEHLENFLNYLGPGEYSLELAEQGGDKTKWTRAYILDFRIGNPQDNKVAGMTTKQMGNMVDMQTADKWRQDERQKAYQEAQRDYEIQELRKQVEEGAAMDPRLERLFNALENNADIILSKVLNVNVNRPQGVGVIGGEQTVQQEYRQHDEAVKKNMGEQDGAKATHDEDTDKGGERDLQAELQQIINEQVHIIGDTETYIDKMKNLTEKLKKNPGLIDLF